MTDEKLIDMANQIAGFFRSYPEDQAATGIREHIAAYWTPKMRQALKGLGSDGRLAPEVRKAVKQEAVLF